jgi:diamine N-acetyltransferase
MAEITLRPLTAENWVECIRLKPTAEQMARHYVADNTLSLAQAYAEPWWRPLAVYAGTTMVGFVMYGRWPHGVQSELWGETLKPGIDYIARMMIDERHQGRGYATAALAEVIAQIKAQGECRAIELDYDRDNVAAGRLYTGCGFRLLRENDLGEIRARLELGDRAGQQEEV